MRAVVLDASVFIAAQRKDEPHHAAACDALRPIMLGQRRLIIPSIFIAEVAGALARKGADSDRAGHALATLVALADEVATLGPRRAWRVADVACAHRIHGADAIYVWLAKERRATLITGDHELATRAGGVCKMAVI